jgi:hypothetical protein
VKSEEKEVGRRKKEKGKRKKEKRSVDGRRENQYVEWDAGAVGAG